MEVLLGLMGIPSFFLLVSCKKPSDFSIALLGAGEPRSGSGLFIIFSDSNCFCLMDIQRRRPGGFTWMDVSSTSAPSDGSCRRRDNVATSFYFSYGHIRRYHGVSLPASAFLGCICHQNVKKNVTWMRRPLCVGAGAAVWGFPS